MAYSRLRKTDARGATLITAVALAPSLALLLGAGDPQSPVELVGASGVVAYALVLGAAVLTYLHWRMISVDKAGESGTRLAPWLAVGLIVGGVNGLMQTAPLETGTEFGTDRWPVLGQLVLMLLLCVIALIAERVDVPADPAVIGAAAAVVITASYCVLMRWAPPLVLAGPEWALLNTAVMLSGLLLAWIVLHRTKVSLWVRRRLALGAVLLTAARCASNLDGGPYILMAGVIAAYLLGALLLCTMTYRLLRNSVLEHQAEVDLLQRSLAEVRAAVLEERELLHEVGATLAGITTASRVMRHNHAVPAHRRQRLESMLAAELARLERLMLARSMGSTPIEDLEVDVDDVIEPIVTSHQTRGRNVLWSSCGERAVCDPDELAEVVNILLENAAQHGGGGATCLSVSATDHDLVVTCSDSGPGVLPELRDRLFEPDVRRAGSSGQGLGLAIAHRLVTARGGSLELTDCERPGATFVARFPSKQLQEALADDDVRHIA